MVDSQTNSIKTTTTGERAVPNEPSKCGSKGLPKKSDVDVKHVILVLSGKGGVGKSTISVNLASALAKNGTRTGILDLDIHGPDLAMMLGVQDRKLQTVQNKIQPVQVTGNLSVLSMAFLIENSTTPIVWRGPMKMAAIQQFLEEVEWGSLDYLVVDLPPGTGDEALSIIQLAPNISGAVVVTTPQHVATLDAGKSIRFVQKMDVRVLGVIENMSALLCPKCGEKIDLFGTGGGGMLAELMDVPFLGSIPLDPSLVRAGDEGRPSVIGQGDSKTAHAIERVIEKIKESL
ncbi:MAG TPA: Mrp/NBP35 family ATP-binding protein [Methanoregulaceae archaeon]|nr:Mrp/NBP35 family ATP-binding protein [Methanoregulaceae archaeon]